MVFSDSTTDQGLVEEARWLVGANTTSYPLTDITRNVNRWYDRAVSLIFEADGRWQWDDPNHESEATYLDDLVSGTQSYDLLVSHLRITRAEVKDQAGNWSRLFLIDQNDVHETLTDFEKTDGTPRFYDLIGNKVYLYPAPNYSQAESLKLLYQRGADYFLTSDTTKAPGFAGLYHRYLSLGAAYDYALKNNLAIRNRIKEEIAEMEEDMQSFYARRAGDENIQMKVRQTSYR